MTEVRKVNPVFARPTTPQNIDLSIIFLLCIASLLAYYTRNHYLDDAFIHLRYAENFNNLGIFSYDGTRHDFGISSPGYVILLSLMLSAGSGIFSPKIASIFFYAASLAILVSIYFSQRRPFTFLILIAALVSPSAIRWLTDGMETSLVVFISICAAWALNKALLVTNYRNLAFLYSILALAPIIRIEFFAIFFFSSILISIEAFHSRPLRLKLIYLITLTPVPALLFYFSTFGQILPDTALAKAGKAEFSSHHIFSYLASIVKVHLANPALTLLMALSFTFGAGYIIKFLRRSHSDARYKIAIDLTLTLGMFLSFIALIVYRNQALHGIRYFLWIEIFSISFILLAIHTRHQKHLPNQFSHNRKAALISCSLLAIALVAEFNLFKPVFYGRSASFTSMKHQSQSEYKDSKCLAFDVGFFGYFYNCNVIDMNGLVSGPQFARLTMNERISTIAKSEIDIIFVNDRQLRIVSDAINFNDGHWFAVKQYEFPNISGDRDTHYVFARQNNSQLRTNEHK